MLPHAKFIDVIANATDNKQEGIVKFLISIKNQNLFNSNRFWFFIEIQSASKHQGFGFFE
jgi:hypothetical protein